MRINLNDYKFEKISPEELLFRFGFPCAEGRYHHKQISNEQLEKLESYYKGENKPSWDVLIKAFGGFTEKTKELMNLNSEEVKDVNKILEYFLIYHNKDLDNMLKQNKIMPIEAKLCKGYIGKIPPDGKRGEDIYYVQPLYEQNDKIFIYRNMFKVDVQNYKLLVVHKGSIILGANKKN